MLLELLEPTKTKPVEDWRIPALEYLERDIQHFVKRFTITGMEDEDVAQELRFALWKNLNNYRPMHYKLNTWTWKVLRNTLTNLERNQTRQKRVINHQVCAILEHDRYVTIETYLVVEEHFSFFQLMYG